MLFLGLAASALATRLLVPGEAGLYFLIMSIATSGAVVVELGVSRVGTRFVAEGLATGQSGMARDTIRKVFAVGGVAATLAFVLLATPLGGWALAGVFGARELVWLAPAVGLWICLRALGQLRAELYRGLHDIRLASIYGGVDAYVLICALFVALLVLPGVENRLFIVAWGSALAWLPGVLVGWYSLNKVAKGLVGPGSVDAGRMAAVAGPLWLMGIGQLAIQSADLWILAIWAEPEDVAIYGAVLRLVALISTPLLVMNQIVPPLIAGMYARGEKVRLSKVLQGTASLAGAPSLVILAILAIGGAPILGLVFGSFYSDGAQALAILAVGQATNVWSGSCAQVLALTGHERALMRITLLSGALMIGVVLALVGPFGMTGVATGATIGLIAKNVLAWRAARRRTDVDTRVSLAGASIALKGLKGFVR